MPGPDFPDWSQQTVAGIRFAGATPVSSGGVQKNLDIAVTTFERAVLVHTPNDPSGVWTIQVIGLTTGRVSSYVTGIGADQWIVAYVNPAFDATWEVQVTNAGAINLYCECFVDTTLPLVRVANVAGQAIPATFDPLGQASSAASVPVVIASDQSAVPVASIASAVAPVSLGNAVLNSGPVTMVIATIGGGSKLRAVSAHFSVRSAGTTGRMQVDITDGTAVWFIGWSYASDTRAGPAVDVVYPVPFVPGNLNTGVVWLVRATLSSVVGAVVGDMSGSVVYGG